MGQELLARCAGRWHVPRAGVTVRLRVWTEATAQGAPTPTAPQPPRQPRQPLVALKLVPPGQRAGGTDGRSGQRAGKP